MSSDALQTVASIFSIVEAVFFIVSVFFIWLQIRESNRLARSANLQSLSDLTSPFLLQLGQDRATAEIWITGSTHFDTMDEVDQFRYIQLLSGWLIIYENMFYQHQNGLLDHRIYRSWEVQLRDFVERMRLASHWEKEFKPFFMTEFGEEVERILAELTDQDVHSRPT
jgi:hypothetical protein